MKKLLTWVDDRFPLTALWESQWGKYVAPKNFKTGSRGYYANGKLELDGKRYQLQIQLVEIGSKLTAPESKPEPKS